MAEEFLFSGSVRDRAPLASQKFRKDERTITTRQRNVLIDAGAELTIVDGKEAGELVSIKVVSDNPYLEVYLEMDDWRNEGETAAGLLYAGNAGGSIEGNFRAIDGQNPAFGYTMLYNPMTPSSYNSRIRIVLRNRLRANRNVYGNQTSLSLPGNLPSPVVCGHTGGASYVAEVLGTATSDQLAYSVSQPVAGDAYVNEGMVNRVFLSANNRQPGIDHPYVGQAGRPTLNLGAANGGAGTGQPEFAASIVDPVVFFDDVDPAKWPYESTQDIYIADLSSAGREITLSNIAVGERLVVRDGGVLHFPGEITAFSNGGQNLPKKFATVGTAVCSDTVKITVAPGLQNAPAPIRGKSGSPFSTTYGPHIGKVTSQADSNPHILIKEIEVKRYKKVSYDG